MWIRANLKENAKVAFKRNYWKCVLVAIILGIVTGSGASSVSTNTQTLLEDETYENEAYDDSIYYDEYALDEEYIINEIFSNRVSTIIATVGITILLIILVIASVVKIFLLNPLEVGCANFFKANAYEQTELNKLTIAFKKNCYWKMVGTIFLRNLFTTLWSFVFIIPGIIKAYEYRMIPYILSDCPEISRKDAFHFSKEMMRGNKWKAFVLDMSFIGWILLTIITCGLAGVFYVNPYRAATEAELFIAIREEYFKGQRE